MISYLFWIFAGKPKSEVLCGPSLADPDGSFRRSATLSIVPGVLNLLWMGESSSGCVLGRCVGQRYAWQHFHLEDCKQKFIPPRWSQKRESPTALHPNLMKILISSENSGMTCLHRAPLEHATSLCSAKWEVSASLGEDPWLPPCWWMLNWKAVTDGWIAESKQVCGLGMMWPPKFHFQALSDF